MKIIATFAATVAVALFVPVAAFAATSGAGGAGKEFGQHHATHAREMGGFTADMNPGVMHRGFSGWSGM